MTTYAVRVDRDLCIGAGKCVGYAPAAFGFDDEDVSTPLPGLSSVPDEDILHAASLCPVSAITVLAGDGRELFPNE